MKPRVAERIPDTYDGQDIGITNTQNKYTVMELMTPPWLKLNKLKQQAEYIITEGQARIRVGRSTTVHISEYSL